MSDLSKATRPPWYVYQFPARYPGIDSAGQSIVLFGVDEGSEAGVRGDTEDEADANAALIVKAVNLHDEFVELIRWLTDPVPEVHFGPDVNGLLHRARILRARIDAP
jgi:hypothetical protein